jgi:hypothetical protein
MTNTAHTIKQIEQGTFEAVKSESGYHHISKIIIGGTSGVALLSYDMLGEIQIGLQLTIMLVTGRTYTVQGLDRVVNEVRKFTTCTPHLIDGLAYDFLKEKGHRRQYYDTIGLILKGE